MLILPVEAGVPFQRFQTTLVGEAFNFKIRWNTRANIWVMDVYSAQDVLVWGGLKLVTGAWIGASAMFKAGFPYGCFLMNDTSGDFLDAGLNDLGTRVELLFIGVAEMDFSSAKDKNIPLPTGVDIQKPVKRSTINSNLNPLLPGGGFGIDDDGVVTVINPSGLPFYK